MVKIRLKRVGTHKRPYFRLVVADSRSPRDGRFIETVGYYDPLEDPIKLEVDGEKVKGWIAKGARPTDAARSLLEHAGVLVRGPKRVYPHKPRKNQPAEEAKAAEAAPAPEVAAEAPAEEASAEPEVAAETEPVAQAQAEAEPAAEAEAE